MGASFDLRPVFSRPCLVVGCGLRTVPVPPPPDWRRATSRLRIELRICKGGGFFREGGGSTDRCVDVPVYRLFVFIVKHLWRRQSSTYGVNPTGHISQQGVVQQLTHEGALFKVLDQTPTDEVVEGSAPVPRLVQ